MPKLLIIEACIVNYGDDRGGQHHDAGAVVEVTKDTATALVRSGRGLYAAKADDPDKTGRNTASAEMLKAAKEMAKAAAAGPATTADKSE